MNNFSIQDIVERIYISLPSRFSSETSTNLYKFITGISAMLKINSDMVDEFIRQTNLVSATGEYVDDYISDLTNIGRKENETDEEYKERYYDYVFRYNCTKSGIEQLIIDINGKLPADMYAVQRRGAYTDGRYYYDNSLHSLVGSDVEDTYKAYIQFGRRPNSVSLKEICEIISAVKAAGVKIYLRYPPGNPLLIDSDEMFGYGTFERVTI